MRRLALLPLAALAVSCLPDASSGNGSAPVSGAPAVLTEVAHDLSRPLREMTPAPRQRGRNRAPLPLPRPPLADTGMVAANAVTSGPAAPVFAMPATAMNFDGVGNGFSGPAGTFTVAAAPPDTIGDVGPNHYVQMVNAELAIFNKSGTALFGPVPTNTIWSGFGFGCQTNNDGDGTVLYDPMADRWILSQFSVSTTPYLECIAISQTGDPTGAYYRYSFSYGTTDFPDYPKLGVWPDAYYVTYNVFANAATFSGARICALDRTKMLAGQAATQQCFNTSNTIGGLLAADLDGSTLPPSGAPEIAVALGASANQLASYKFHVNWTTPASTTFVGPTLLATTAFTEPCAPSGTCIPQSGTAQKLDSLGDRLMHRLAYRNFGDHEALVVAHSIVAGSSTGLRWYELRPDPSTRDLSIFQQGTYAPDASFRWMPSIAMDRLGDIAIGFSLSSPTLNPQIHYAGRLATDAAGSMPQGEGTILNGAGSQSGSNLSRWGDYSSMNVDPSNDCAFWYTNEYIPSTGAFNWKTRIGSFTFPRCLVGDFTMSSAPSSLVTAGGAVTTLVSTTAAGAGSADTVTLSATGVPAGTTASFAPVTMGVGSASTLTLTVGATTPGRYPITVTATGAAHTHTALVGLRVDAIPVANADSYTVLENGVLNVGAPGVLANDTDADLDPLKAVLATGPAHGTLSLGTNGSFTYTPTSGYFGPDSFTYRANDGIASSAPATVAIKVDAPPTANPDSYVAEKNVTLTVAAPGVLANDTDPNLDPLKAQLVTPPTHGTVTLGTDGSLTYAPSPGYAGPDSFTYRASDGFAFSAAATVAIRVDTRPVANPDSGTVLMNGSLSVAAPGVLSNDTDADGDPLTASLVAGPAHGSLTLNAAGSYLYTPVANYTGSDSFLYAASDGALSSNATTVTIRVDAAPVANNDAYTVAQNGTLSIAAPGVLANDTDANADPLVAVLATMPAHGTLTLNGNGSFTYVPTTGYAGPDSFTYKANDGFASSASATVSITVDAPPVARNDAYSVNQGTTLTVAAPGVLANDTDPEASPLSASLVTNVAHGTLALSTNGSFTYTPNASFFGADGFTYAASDAFGSATATVSITVVHVNHPPVAVDDAYDVNEDGSVTVPPAAGVLANDSDPDADPLTAVLVTSVTHGVLVLSANGGFTYTPTPLFHGTDSFTYRANDGALSSGAATVRITVHHVNHPPVAVADEYATEIDQPLHALASHSTLLNDHDVDGDALTTSVDVQPVHGAVVLSSDGTFVYTPASDLAGDDSFTYRVFDGAALSTAAQVTIHVGGVDRPPAVPVPVSPVVGAVIPQAAQHFEWKASSDGEPDDPMHYHLRVLQGGTVVKDLTLASLTQEFTGAAALLPGAYRWQVEAIDSAGVVSGPSAPILFVVPGAGHRGCDCDTTGGAGSASTALAPTLLAVAAVVAARRRARA